MNKICSNCGSANEEENCFCLNCGQTLLEESELLVRKGHHGSPQYMPTYSEPRFGGSDTVRSFDGMDKLDPTAPSSDSEEKKSPGIVRKLFGPLLDKFPKK